MDPASPDAQGPRPSPGAPPLAARWGETGAGERYRDRRFRDARAAGRDPRLVARLLRRWPLRAGESARVLDVPCGAGRLHRALSSCPGARVVSADLSPEMLRALPAPGPRLRADALRLPFADDAFDLVVCCRLLHHLEQDDARRTLLAELLRVSRGRVLVSFWDSASWHAWRRRVGLRRGRRPDPRVAITRGRLEQLARQAGARVLGHAASFRFVSPQTFCALERES